MASLSEEQYPRTMANATWAQPGLTLSLETLFAICSAEAKALTGKDLRYAGPLDCAETPRALPGSTETLTAPGRPYLAFALLSQYTLTSLGNGSHTEWAQAHFFVAAGW
jgi:hypothetical protein